MTASAALVALLGGSTVLVLLVGLWFPGYLRTRDLRRRLAVLVAYPGATAVDLGGRRRARGVRRTHAEGNALYRMIQTHIESAALDMTPGEILATMGILAAAAGLIGAVTAGIVAALIGAMLGLAVPLVWLRLRRARRQRAFVEQLPDTVALLASTVRGGHSLLQGLEQVARESLEPTRSAIEQVVREIGLGAAQEEALERLGQRYPSEDLDLIVVTINVQSQVGGSLAHSLQDMAETLRERERIAGDIRALTAQQRYSAYVLALLPVAVGAALFLISHDYISLLFEGMLRIAAVAAALLVAVGFVVMRRIASIDV